MCPWILYSGYSVPASLFHKTAPCLLQGARWYIKNEQHRETKKQLYKDKLAGILDIDG